jgi:hypothetical protein
MTAALVITATVLALVLVFLSSVTVHFRLLRRGEDDRITFTVAWLKYLRYSVDVPLVDLLVRTTGPEIRLKTAFGRPETVSFNIPQEIRASVSFLLEFYRRYGRYAFALWYLAGRTRIRRFRWYSEIGLGEAHRTGLATGIAWALKSSLVTGLFAHTVPLSKPDLAVRPNYQEHRLNTFLDCIFQIRVGDFMVAVLKAIWAR